MDATGKQMVTKNCPYCAEEIQEEAVKCKHCSSWIGGPTRVKPARPLSRAFYLPSIIGGNLLGSVLTALALPNIDEDAGPLILVLGVAFLVYSVVVFCLLLSKLWGAIQGGPVRTTPGKAVGFLFIPFFNLYWIFQAIWGWTVDFNRTVEHRRAAAPQMPVGLGLAVCIVLLAGIVPLVGFVAIPVSWVLQLLLWNRAIGGVNALMGPWPPVDPAVRARRRRWAFGALGALVLVAIAIPVGAWIAEAGRIRAFKAEARRTAERVGPDVARSIVGLDPSTAERPPRELYDVMRELDELQIPHSARYRFTYAVLYLPDPANENVLWRYQGKSRHTPYEEDSSRLHSWGGFKRIEVETDFKKAAVRALGGDSTPLDAFNREAKASRQSVVVGSGGTRLAVLRLTIWGIGGEERRIR